MKQFSIDFTHNVTAIGSLLSDQLLKEQLLLWAASVMSSFCYEQFLSCTVAVMRAASVMSCCSHVPLLLWVVFIYMQLLSVCGVARTCSCSDVQLLWCEAALMCSCSDVQLLLCAVGLMCCFSDVQLLWCAAALMCSCSDVQLLLWGITLIWTSSPISSFLINMQFLSWLVSLVDIFPHI